MSVGYSRTRRVALNIGPKVKPSRGRQQGTSDVDSLGICESMSDTMKSFIEEAKKREEESARERRRLGEEREAERRRWEEEKNNWEMRMEEERQRQDEELQCRDRNNEKQLELLQLMVQGVQLQGETAVRRAEQDKDVNSKIN